MLRPVGVTAVLPTVRALWDDGLGYDGYGWPWLLGWERKQSCYPPPHPPPFLEGYPVIAISLSGILVSIALRM